MLVGEVMDALLEAMTRGEGEVKVVTDTGEELEIKAVQCKGRNVALVVESVDAPA